VLVRGVAKKVAAACFFCTAEAAMASFDFFAFLAFDFAPSVTPARPSPEWSESRQGAAILAAASSSAAAGGGAASARSDQGTKRKRDGPSDDNDNDRRRGRGSRPKHLYS
jgi:hypothetical protein